MIDDRLAGIVLCGGRSLRMGSDKAMLPFGDEAMLTRVVRLLREAVPHVVVVAGPRQTLPNLPAEVQILRDAQEGYGPLPALGLGLSSLPLGTTAAYVTSCDAPLLRPAFVRRVIDRLLNDHGSSASPLDASVPLIAGRLQPLCAAYHAGLSPQIQQCLDDGVRSMVGLLDRLRIRRLTEADCADVDPSFDSLRNVNSPSDYARALSAAGLPTAELPKP